MRLAVHPDDPPFPLFGLPRVVSTGDDLRALLAAVASPANGLTFCTGSFGARADNDVPALAREFAPHVHFAHLRNVTTEPDGSFYEAEHLDGGTDMVAVIGALMAEEARRGDRRSRCAPTMATCSPTTSARRTNPGYSLIGRLKGLAELRGVMRTTGTARQSAPRPGRMTPAETRRDGWAAFRHRDFTLYFTSRFASGLAIQMQNVAVGWRVYDLTSQPTATFCIWIDRPEAKREVK